MQACGATRNVSGFFLLGDPAKWPAVVLRVHGAPSPKRATEPPGPERGHSPVNRTVGPSGPEPVAVSARGSQGRVEFGRGCRGHPARGPSDPTPAAAGPTARRARVRVDPPGNPSVRPDYSSGLAAVRLPACRPTAAWCRSGRRSFLIRAHSCPSVVQDPARRTREAARAAGLLAGAVHNDHV
jgi:hypothetical protein